MEKCRKSYINEIDIIEHIMQFRAVKAEFEKRMGRGTDQLARSLQARTKTVVAHLSCSEDEEEVDESDDDDYADGDAQGTERKGTDRNLVNRLS